MPEQHIISVAGLVFLSGSHHLYYNKYQNDIMFDCHKRCKLTYINTDSEVKITDHNDGGMI